MFTPTKDAQEALLWIKDGYPDRGYEFRKWELGATREITYSFVSKNDKEMVDALKAAIKVAPVLERRDQSRSV
jgi:hypothetical protein